MAENTAHCSADGNRATARSEDRKQWPLLDTTKETPASRRIGRSALLALTLTSLIIAAIVGFLGFIFFGDINNKNWHAIMVRGWVTRAISIPSLFLRSAVDVQTGIVAAMLAALALESGSVLLQDAAKVSKARAERTRPRTLIIPLISGSRSNSRYSRNTLTLGAVMVLALTNMVLQFSSTILLSDLRLGTLPGSRPQNRAVGSSTPPFSVSGSIVNLFLPIERVVNGTVGLSEESSPAVDLSYITDDPMHSAPGGWWVYGLSSYTNNMLFSLPTWLRKAAVFPRFAEYSEPALPREGVDDTGVLLRAFLPYFNSGSRESLRNYSGDALVLDSRVSCQRPALEHLSFETPHRLGSGFNLQNTTEFNIQLSRLVGTFAPTIRDASKLTTPGPIPFNCSYLIANQTHAICSLAAPPLPDATFPNGSTAIAMANRAGGLISEFSNLTDPQVLQNKYDDPLYMITWGTPYLIFNVTSRHSYRDFVGQHWEFFYSNYTLDGNITYSIEEDELWSTILTRDGPANLSVSLCYTAFDTGRMPVKLFAQDNHSEPNLQWQKNVGYFTQPSLNLQLGNVGSNQSGSSRGILDIEKKTSWIPPPEMARPYALPPFVQQNSAMDPAIAPSAIFSMPGNASAIWSFSESVEIRTEISMVVARHQADQEPVISPDNTLGYVFDSALSSSSSIARAMSSLITVLSSLAYYDQLPQFDARSNVTQMMFTTVLFPKSNLGFYTIVAVLVLHLFLAVLVTSFFALYSRFTFLGNHWQSVAQLYSIETFGLFNESGMITDKEVRARLKATDTHGMAVGVRGEEGNVCLIRNEIKSSHSSRMGSFASSTPIKLSKSEIETIATSEHRSAMHEMYQT